MLFEFIDIVSLLIQFIHIVLLYYTDNTFIIRCKKFNMVLENLPFCIYGEYEWKFTFFCIYGEFEFEWYSNIKFSIIIY